MCDPSVRGMPRPIAAVNSPSPSGPRKVGVPVPYVVKDSQNLGDLDDAGRGEECARLRLYQICGEAIGELQGYGIPKFGEMATFGFNGHALMHHECLKLALEHCPQLHEWIEKGQLFLVREPPGCPYQVIETAKSSEARMIDPTSVDWGAVVETDAKTPWPRTRTRTRDRLKAEGLVS